MRQSPCKASTAFESLVSHWADRQRSHSGHSGRGIYESYTLDPLDQAVEQAWQAGIVVVVAAGNYGRDNSNNNFGYRTITSPGNDPYVITVGAMRDMGTYTTTDDVIATDSSKGPTMDDQVVKPDLVAAGNPDHIGLGRQFGHTVLLIPAESGASLKLHRRQ